MENLITEIDILDESKDNFLTYAEEVLTDRSIPSAEDGLLSAQRKILWTLEDYLKMDSKSKTKKCNAIVGSTLATSYFHGDQACYGVLCKMSQEYLMRYPLITGQGSLGTQENNDIVASSRYTEAKPSIYTDLMMNDFKKNVVPLKETYNGEFMEPVVLPSLFPNALCNGKQAIGISISHNSAPHNLSEVCDAIIAYLDNNNITIEEILKIMPGPDFPLPNTIMNTQDVKEAYRTGKSKTSLKIRGEYEIKGQDIIFTSIPYRTYRNKIKEQIDKNIEVLEKFIDDFDDESNIGKNRLVFHVNKNYSPETVVEKLFALTDLQTTLSYNMNFIVNGTPKLCSIIDLIKAYTDHQINVLIKATEYDKDKAEKRKHILEGLLIAIDKIDLTIKLIRESDNRNAAKQSLIKFLGITEEQAEAILDMKLSRLTKLDKESLLKELQEKIDIIEECNKILTIKNYRIEKIKEKVFLLKKKYGDARRTKLLYQDISTKKEDKEIETVIPEDVVVILSQSGNIKRIPKTSFRTQRRGGKGVKTVDEAITATIKTNTIDNLLLFTDKGKMYKILVDNLPIGTNVSKGTHISSLIKIDEDEKIIAITNLAKENHNKYVVFITKKGLFKKTLLEEYTTVKKSTGIAAIKLKENDSIANIELMNEEDIVLITKQGMSIHFETKDIAAIGRVTSGVKTIKLEENDEVLVGLPIRNEKETLSVFACGGNAKKISIDDLPVQGRVGKGLSIYKEKLAGATMINDEDNLLLIGKNSICISAKEIPLLSRTSIGNNMIKNSEINSIVKL